MAATGAAPYDAALEAADQPLPERLTRPPLIAPHLARLLLKKNNLNSWLFAGLIGACLLLGADLLARSVSSAEIPVSILTSLIGVPLLITIVLRRGQVP